MTQTIVFLLKIIICLHQPVGSHGPVIDQHLLWQVDALLGNKGVGEGWNRGRVDVNGAGEDKEGMDHARDGAGTAAIATAVSYSLSRA